MASTVLIVGGSGLVGSALLREFDPHYRTVGTFCSNPKPNLVQLDLRNPSEIRSVIREIRADVVCCPAAQHNVERCEVDSSETRKVNVKGLQNLIEVVGGTGAYLVYFSTEYVFDGTA